MLLIANCSAHSESSLGVMEPLLLPRKSLGDQQDASAEPQSNERYQFLPGGSATAGPAFPATCNCCTLAALAGFPI
jgi:hypothetical protein